MPDLPRFKTLRAYRDPVSAAEWNGLTAAVSALCRSLGAGGIFDSGGLHIRAIRSGHRPAFFKIHSNEGGGRYLLRPQAWTEQSQAFSDSPGRDDVPGYEIGGDASLAAGQIVGAFAECSLEGQWVLLFQREQTAAVCWGVASASWQSGNATVNLHPCADEQGTNVNSQVTIECYVLAPIYNAASGSPPPGLTGIAPDGCQIAANDVLAYVALPATGKGLLVSPPLRLPPGGATYQIMQKCTASAYDYAWDWAHFADVAP